MAATTTCTECVAGRSLEGDEAGRVGRADAGLAVLDRLVGDGELRQVVADHVGLDLDLVEGLAVVDADHGADHLGEDDHVAQVRADRLGLLAGGAVLLGAAQLLDQGQVTALEAAREPVRRGWEGAGEVETGLLLREAGNWWREITGSVFRTAKARIASAPLCRKRACPRIEKGIDFAHKVASSPPRCARTAQGPGHGWRREGVPGLAACSPRGPGILSRGPASCPPSLPAALARGHELDQLARGHVQELLQVHPPVGVLPERALPARLDRHDC